jgi:hypothetical protein
MRITQTLHDITSRLGSSPRWVSTGLLALALVAGQPSPAHADATAFWGYSPTPSNRSATGFAVGVNIIVVGFEFEYSHVAEDSAAAATGIGSGMINALIQTPTHTQLYVTAGGGFYHETLNSNGHTGFGSNVGGGIKLPLAGPLRLRIDYRVFNLHGSAAKNPKRLYAGINLSF